MIYANQFTLCVADTKQSQGSLMSYQGNGRTSEKGNPFSAVSGKLGLSGLQ